MKAGFIGLGRMGSAMAANLVKAGHDVTVFNRTPDKRRALVALGAREATSVVSMSTIGVAVAKNLARSHAARGQRFVAAPVFGRPDMAAAAKLFIVAAGNCAAIATCRPLFEAMGQKTISIGPDPSWANLVKLSGNFLLASVIASLGEAIALVGQAGIDRRAYVDLLTSTIFPAPAYKTYGELIAEGRFKPAGFAAPLGFKDVRLALAAAESLNVPMPVGSLIHDLFLRLLNEGGAELDWAALGGMPTRDAGDVEPETP